MFVREDFDTLVLVKRLLKFVTIFFVVVTCLMPFLECFDRWDPPGLANDTELPVFLIALFVTLVLLAVFAMARRILEDQGEVTTTEIRFEILWVIVNSLKNIVIAPFIIPPLRI